MYGAVYTLKNYKRTYSYWYFVLIANRRTAHSEDVFKQLEASWDTNEERSAAVLPEASASNIYKPDADDNLPINASYEEFESPFKCVVLYNYTVRASTAA